MKRESIFRDSEVGKNTRGTSSTSSSSIRYGWNPALLTWCLFALAVLFLSFTASAQNYAITSSVISSGGGTSTNANFAITGTIGQTDAGPKMSGGGFAVEGGFWQAITLVQTPGAPLLQITRNGTQATIFWDTAVTGFILESTASLSAPVNWQPVGGVANNSVNVPATTGILFFRLRQAP